MSSLIEKLEKLVLEDRMNRKNTILLGLKVIVPWLYENWADVMFYDSRSDPDVLDMESLAVKYMTGRDVPPHVTLAIADDVYKKKVDNMKNAIEDADLQSLTFTCKSPLCFPQSQAAKALNGKGRAVVMKLQVSEDAVSLRNAMLSVIPCPKDVFNGLRKDTVWSPHVTVGYVRADDLASQENLMRLLGKYVGCKVKVAGWA